jgi:hypothetical protein
VHTPTYASWLNQIEIYFSIIQRKLLKPNDYVSGGELAEAIHAFGSRYSALDNPSPGASLAKISNDVCVNHCSRLNPLRFATAA